MESVEPISGRVPSMYNPKFVKSVREKRRREALHRRLERQGETAEAKAIRNDLLKVPIVRELSRQERVKLASVAPVFRRIVLRLCRVYRVYPIEFFSKRRTEQLSLVRFAVAYWTCRLTKLTLTQIGKLMERDHTTVMYGKTAYVKKRAAMGRTLRPAR